MKTIDKYLIFQFLKALCGSLVFMLGMYIITIYIDNLKYFTHPNVRVGLIFSYILNLIPEIATQVLPAAALFSTSYIFGNMNSSNEIIAIYNGKIGFTRLIAPLIILGVILAAFSFLFFEFISTQSTGKAFEMRNSIRKLSGKSLSYLYSNSKCFLKGHDGTIYYAEYLNSDDGVMTGPVIFQFDENGNLIFQMSAGSGIYDETRRIWTFNNAHIIYFDGKTKYQEQKKAVYSMILSETPKSFLKTPFNVMQMRINDALKFIEGKRKSGVDYKKFLVEFHWRFAFPFSVVITILIGSVAGIYFRKAVLVLSFFLSIIISFGYYGILAIGMAYGKSGKLDPIVAAWMANVIYAAGGVLALKFKK